MTTRRQFLQTGLFTATAAAFSGQMLFAQSKKVAITLAVQTYTLRKFDFEEIIKKTREAGINEVEIAGGNTFWGGERKRSVDLNTEERKKLRSMFEETGVRAISLGGSQGTPQDFEFAKELGLDFLQGEPPIEKLVEVSKRAEEYGIRYSLHDHPKPSRYWDYRETLKRVQDCAPALGICPDTGHFIRSGFDPLEVIRAFKGRMVSVHMKDLDGTNSEADPEIQKKLRDVAWGTGKGQTEAILKELIDQKFVGPIIIEYDHIYDDGNVADVKKCEEFFRKLFDKTT